MFSITAKRVRLLVSWNVRTIPRAAILCDATPSIDSPSNDQLPASGLSNPVTRLKNVVLPAPLGPINAVIEPRCTSTRSTSTAVIPPKLRRTPTALRIGSGLCTPGSGATSESAWRAIRAVSESDGASDSASIEGQLPAVAEQTLRPERHQRDQHRTHEHEHHLTDLGGLDDRAAAPPQRPVAHELTEHALDEGVDRPEQHRSHDRPGDLGDAAQHQPGEYEEGEVATEVVGLHVGGAQGEDHAAEGPDHAAHDQRLHLVAVDVLAEAPNGVFVLADGLQHAAPRAP